MLLIHAGNFALLQETHVLEYSEKTIHIAVAEKPLIHEGGTKAILRGLVFDPARVYDKTNTSAERYFADFFVPGESYRTIAVRTCMGPGELTKVLFIKFGVDCHIWIGALIAPFTLDPRKIEEMVSDLTQHPELYLESEEQKRFVA